LNETSTTTAAKDKGKDDDDDADDESKTKQQYVVPKGPMKNHAIWKERIHQLTEYALHHDGDTNVPQSYSGNKSLGTWVHKQRCQYKLYKSNKKNQLNLERVKSLDYLGFQWQPRYEQMRKWKQEKERKQQEKKNRKRLQEEKTKQEKKQKQSDTTKRHVLPRTPTPTSLVSVLMYSKEEEEIDDGDGQELFIQCIADEVISKEVELYEQLQEGSSSLY
jgi:hypothetical protein